MSKRKKLQQKICAIAIVASMLASSVLTGLGTYVGTNINVNAATSSSEETLASSFEYVENEDGGITITKFIGDETSVVIPSKIDGKVVMSIGNSAFSFCESLISVTIGNSVTSIGEQAFWACESLNNVILGNSLISIDYGAFGYTNITDIVIPNSVTSIGGSAFSFCTNLEKIEIPNSVTSIGVYAFERCTNLKEINVDKNNKNYSSINGVLFNKDKRTLIKFPAGKVDTKYSILNSVTSIDIGAFRYCTSLTDVSIGNSVISIGERAFEGCEKLGKVDIPKSVKYIGNSVFDECKNLSNISVDKDNLYYLSLDGILFNKDKTVIIRFPINHIKVSYVIPNTVKKISDNSFTDCEKLLEITFPKNIDDVESGSLYNTGWYNNLPDGLVYVGKVAYDYKGEVPDNGTVIIKDGITQLNAIFTYSNIRKIVLPEGLEYIESCAFRFSKLEEINIPDSLIYLGDYALNYTPWIEKQPDGVIYAGKIAMGYKGTTPKKITIKENTKIVNLVEFDENYSSSSTYNTTIETIFIPDSVISIQNMNRLEVLQEVDVDKNNKNYSSEDGVLYNKDKTDLIHMPKYYTGTYVMPDTVSKIETDAFNDDISYMNIFFSNAIKSIDTVILIDGYVVIPETVTYISNDALKSVSAIYGYKNSEAQKYAEKNNITFIDMDSVKKETGKYTLSSKNNDKTFVFMASSDNFYNFSFKSENIFKYKLIDKYSLNDSEVGMNFQYTENLKKGDIVIFELSENASDININISNDYEDILNNQTPNQYVDYKYKNKIVYIRGNGCIPDNYDRWDSSFYYNLDINNIVIENGITSIGSRVFYNLRNLQSVYIPESVTQIADDAFIYKYSEPADPDKPIISDGEDKIMDYITIYGAKNSYAEIYAKEKNIPFVIVNGIKDKNSNITVMGDLPSKIKLTVQSLSYKDIYIGYDTAIRAYYDINLSENGKEIQSNVPVIVKIPYSDNTNNIEVYRINDNGTTEKMLSNYSNGVITFVTDHFSKYAIVTTGLLGDTNGDNKVNIADALMIARYDAKLVTLTDGRLSVSDVTGDGKVNIADALKIARYDAKLIDSL